MQYKNLFFVTALLLFINIDILKADFYSLNTNKAYIRAGPGKWYPIKWVLKVKGLPVKILKENGGYKNILLHDGTEGWIYSNFISQKRYVIVIKDDYLLNKRYKPIAKIKKHVVLELLNCNDKISKFYCKVKSNQTTGYIKKTMIWGIK